MILKRLTLAILCLFLLTSCSTKIAYNLLGFALNWYVDSYVSLDNEQEKKAKQAIKDFHEWHRSTQLIIYANYIEQFSEKVAKTPPTGEFLHAESDQVQLFLDDATEQLIPTIVDILSSLSDKQVDELLGNLEKERTEYREDYVEAKRVKVVKKRIKDLRSFIKPFFGRFSDDQETMIEQWGYRLIPYEHFALQQQELSAQWLKDALATRQDTKNLERVVRNLMFYRSDDYFPEYEKAMDVNQKITFELFANLYNSQSDKQRKKTFKKLENYKQDLLDLTRNTAEVAP